MVKGLKRLNKRQLVERVKEQEAELASLRAQVEGDEGVWVIESTIDGKQFFPDTSEPDKPKHLVLGPYERVAIDESWIKHPGLRRAIAAGRVKGPFHEKEMPTPPIPVEVPTDLELVMPIHKATVDQILTRPVKEMLPTINVHPKGARGTTDVHYLKNTMLPILKNAQYRVQKGEGRPGQRGDLLRALKKRIKEIQAF